jgi:KaiC/GvpD/RAD55 family RecA-like ATPase
MRIQRKLRENVKPLDFIDHLSDHAKHIMLLYESSALGRIIEYRFIKNGLLEGQDAVYTTHDDPTSVKGQMEEFGIDVAKYRMKNQLHVVRITDPTNHPKGLQSGLEEIVKRIKSTEVIAPFRIVANFVPDIETTKRIMANTQIESMIDAAYSDGESGELMQPLSDGTLLCPYPINKCQTNMRQDWLQGQFAHHDAAVFMPVQLGNSNASHLT